MLDPNNIGNATKCQAIPYRLPKKIRKFGYIPEHSDLSVGDLLLLSSCRPSFLDRRIIWIQQCLCAPADAEWTHAAVYIGGYSIVEATGKSGVRVSSIFDRIPDYKIRVRRPSFEEQNESWRLVVRALMRISQPYARRRAVEIYLRTLAMQIFPKRHISRAGKSVEAAAICSELCVEAYAESTGRVLLDPGDGYVLPADLAACTNTQEVNARWAKLP